MIQNDKLSNMAEVIFLVWILINMISDVDNIIRKVLSHFLFRKWKYYKFDIISNFIFSKKFEKKILILLLS